jgi:hypothetical protein
MDVREGKGWRLVTDPDRQPFAVLIGGGDPSSGGWAAELTAAEAEALRRGVTTLVEQHRSLQPTLMAEEALDLELAMACGGGELWLALAGDRASWSLRFVLTPAAGCRALEGSWPAAASEAMAAALAALPVLQP